MNILYILLALGIVGHAINMYCDRILSIFPNGTLKLVNYSKLKEGDYAAKLMEGVSPSVPMRSGVLGVFAIVLEFCGYAALAAYAYQKAPVYGAILFAGTTFACIVSSAYHLKCGLVEYMFLKYGRDERAKGMMLDLMGQRRIPAPVFFGNDYVLHHADGCYHHRRDWLPNLGARVHDSPDFHRHVPPANRRARCISPRWCQCLAGCS